MRCSSLTTFEVDLTSGSTAVVYGYSYRNTIKGAMVKFDISMNTLCAPGLKHLAEALKANKTMTELNIAENYATNDGNDNTDMSGVIALADAIPRADSGSRATDDKTNAKHVLFWQGLTLPLFFKLVYAQNWN